MQRISLLSVAAVVALGVGCGGGEVSSDPVASGGSSQAGASGSGGQGGGGAAGKAGAGISGTSGHSGAPAGSAGASVGGSSSGAGGAGSAGASAGGSENGGMSGGGMSAGGSAAAGGDAAGGSGAVSGAAGAAAGGANGVGGGPAGAAGATAAGAAGAPTAGASGAAGSAGQFCGTTQCTDCLDNDGDGLTDALDPDCTGYLDNDEGSFATGIPGDNVDACKQDCFFDGNSGQGDDKCEWNLACDPKNPGQNLGCPYNPTQKNCPSAQSAACVKNCQKLTPNGCDCFGCCAFPVAGGTRSVLLLPTCTYADIDDPVKCPVCTQSDSCNNPCETCELCLGKNELPPGCTSSGTGGASGTGGTSGTAGTTSSGGSSAAGTSGVSGSSGTGGTPLPQCDAGVTPCDAQHPCGTFEYCLTGCCLPYKP